MSMHKLAQLDRRYLWHPFTQMRDWMRQEPILIVEGSGATLRDTRGQEYLDANASIWTNLHGHRHPAINAAIHRQLEKIAHSSALGLANEPASLLGAKLVGLANRMPRRNRALQRHSEASPLPLPRLEKVFFSDDGSTAMEVALKLAYEVARRSGRAPRPRFLSLAGAYHGDTVGAVSLGHIDLFHKAYAGLLFKSDVLPAPYCYRCPSNRARPERADARDYRRCHWECLRGIEARFARRRKGNPVAAVVFEPLIQGAAGMIAQPPGWLGRLAELARAEGALLIADEVMTGFGRTGTVFACHAEGVRPDFLVLAKGLTGGYLPMAATLTTRAVFDAFLGDYSEFKTFFHGHSYTGNQLGAAAALASLELLASRAAIASRARLARVLAGELERLWAWPNIGDIRQVGLIAGIELVRNWRTREPFELGERAGIRVCEAMAKRGVLTRPIGNVVVLMPPYCATPAQVGRMVQALAESVETVLA
jgi:adenosylmethionine-8-amino-7-oxononanoate aminotransferase